MSTMKINSSDRDGSIEPYGIKLIGNYLFDRKLGEQGLVHEIGYVSPGHNSTYYDEETGKYYLIFHTRFPGRGEAHEIRVHQMFFNEDGWPVVAPYRYAGEELVPVNKDDVVGSYKLIKHGREISALIKTSNEIILHEDGTISGSISGNWEMGGNNLTLYLADKEYSGVIINQWNESYEQYGLTFSVLSTDRYALWGSKIMNDQTDEEIVQAIHDELDLGVKTVKHNIVLPTEGFGLAKIYWNTSHPEYTSKNGEVTRPKAGHDPVEVTLTATITKGESLLTKDFVVTVLPWTENGLVVHYAFENNFADSTNTYGMGIVTGNLNDRPGGMITFTEGIEGLAALFD